MIYPGAFGTRNSVGYSGKGVVWYMHHYWSSGFTFRAYNIEEYPCKTKQAAAIMLMIMNNLDPRVAQV